MGYSFWGSSNGKYCIVENGGTISLKKDEKPVWENSVDGIGMTCAEVADSGAVLIHGSGLCYYVPAGSSKIIPVNNLPYNNLLTIHGHFIKMSEDGLKIAYVRSETKKGLSLFGFGKGAGNGLQVEYELIIETLETGKQKSIYKINIPMSLSEYLVWDISGDFLHAMISVPKQNGRNIDISVYNFDFNNVSDKMKKMSLKNVKIIDSRIHNTGNIAIRLSQNSAESLIVMNKNFEVFNMDVSPSETMLYLARGFIVFEEKTPSGGLTLSVKKIEGDVIAKYDMNVFTDNNIDFAILFKENEKDFLNIVYVLNEKFFSYPSDILTLPTELKRVEISLMSGTSNRVSSSEGMTYFSDYFDTPASNFDEVSSYVVEEKSDNHSSLYPSKSESLGKNDNNDFSFDFGQYSEKDNSSGYNQNEPSIIGSGIPDRQPSYQSSQKIEPEGQLQQSGGISLDFNGSSALKSRKIQKNVPSSLSLPSSGKLREQVSQPVTNMSRPSSGRLDSKGLSLPSMRSNVPQQLSLGISNNNSSSQAQNMNQYSQGQDMNQYQQNQYSQAQDMNQYQQNQYSQAQDMNQYQQNQYSQVQDMNQYQQNQYSQAQDMNQYQQNQYSQAQDMNQYQQNQYSQAQDMNQYQQNQYSQPQDMNQYQQNQYSQAQDMNQYQQNQYPQVQDMNQYQNPYPQPSSARGVDPEIKKLEKMIESLEDRYLLGEINEDSYNDLKSKYLRQLKAKKAGV